MARPHHSISIDIDAPPQRVFEVMVDVRRWHEWTPSITSITLASGGELAVGTRARIQQPKLPPALWTVSRIDCLKARVENHAYRI